MKKNDLKKRFYNLNNNMSNNTITTVNIDDSAKEESDHDDIVDIENDDDKLLKITGFTNTVQKDGRVPKKGEKYYHYWQNFKNMNYTSVLLYKKYELDKNTILKKDREKTCVYDKKYTQYIKSRRICTKCTVDKDLNDDFSKCSKMDSGREYTCKTCRNQQKHEYLSTSDGCIKVLLNDCKSTSKRRGEKGRVGASEFTLTEEQVKEMFKEQGGLCHCYKSPLKFTRGGDKMSIERLDNTKGYTRENCVLVCQLSNGFAQTTLKSIKDAMDFIELTEEEKINNLKQYDLTKPPLKKRVKIEEKINVEGIKTYNCTYCGERKTFDQFGKNYKCGCKNCMNNVEYIKPYNTMKRMCNSAKSNSKARAAKGRPNMVCEITIDDFIDIFKKQYGLCAISHMPLEFHNVNISIDRIDTSIGYTKVNTQLVRSQYNISDCSAVLIKRKGESGVFDCGWTREKFLIKIKGLKDYYNKKNIVDDVVEEKIIPVVVKLIENRKGKRWTEDENVRLEGLNKEKVSREKIAEMMGRTEKSIKKQISKLNL